MSLEDMIREVRGFQLVRRGDTPEETVNNVCEAGFAILGRPVPELSMKDKLAAASSFFMALLIVTEKIEHEIMEKHGLRGGARGRGTMADLAHLGKDESLEVHQITAALLGFKDIHNDILLQIKKLENRFDNDRHVA